ncbi:MAG: KTSC domain-containing protein [Firmicutes bacterium HGW-Firmicutes-2]|jgi:hypothetical protein|nr:MAG: KTSC domain-containing protein [Firmicutes bacterium HGW-Firmicutes-2]
MEMISVNSSHIEAIGYDEDKAVLIIEFLSGAAYEYYDIPSYMFDELMSADSKGTYANENLYKRLGQSRIR